MRQIQVLHVLGDRPDRVTDHWEIYNAPRPIFGHEQWQGDFITGVFYTGVDPDATDAPEMRERNRQLRAVRLEWVDEETAFQAQREWYLREYPDTAGELVDDPAHRLHVVRAYFRRMNESEEEGL